MARSSLLGVERADPIPAGRDIDSLGTSDNSDSGSDVQSFAPAGIAGSNGDPYGDHGADSDAAGTGERGAVARDGEASDRDILPDRITGHPDTDAAASLGDAVADDDEDELDDGDDRA